MPTILQINSCANWGSTGKIAEQINCSAAAEGWKTFIAFGRSSNPCQSEEILIGSTVSRAIAFAEARLFDNEGLSNCLATKRLVKIIKKIKPDVIHLHNLHGYYINYKVLFQYLNSVNIPLVWTLHDCWTFTGHCSHFVGSKCERWKTECKACPLTKSYPASWLFSRAERNFKQKRQLFTANEHLHFVTVSHWLEDFVKVSFFKGYDIRCIYNGIDLNMFKPAVTPKPACFRVLGVSSVWSNSKGLRDFITLRDMLDENQYEIVLVGLNSSQISALPKGIIGIPRVDSVEELVEYYSSADMYLNLTYADTFPTTNMEALACGTPVLTYRTGGSVEAVSPDTGWIVEQGDLATVAGIIKGWSGEIAENPALGQEKRLKCRKRAEERFDKDVRFNEYVELYNSLVSG